MFIRCQADSRQIFVHIFLYPSQIAAWSFWPFAKLFSYQLFSVIQSRHGSLSSFRFLSFRSRYYCGCVCQQYPSVWMQDLGTISYFLLNFRCNITFDKDLQQSRTYRSQLIWLFCSRFQTVTHYRKKNKLANSLLSVIHPFLNFSLCENLNSISSYLLWHASCMLCS